MSTGESGDCHLHWDHSAPFSTPLTDPPRARADGCRPRVTGVPGPSTSFPTRVHCDRPGRVSASPLPDGDVYVAKGKPRSTPPPPHLGCHWQPYLVPVPLRDRVCVEPFRVEGDPRFLSFVCLVRTAGTPTPSRRWSDTRSWTAVSCRCVFVRLCEFRNEVDLVNQRELLY